MTLIPLITMLTCYKLRYKNDNYVSYQFYSFAQTILTPIMYIYDVELI